MDGQKLLSVGDAARRLGISSAGVVAMERTGKLQAIRTEGGMRLFAADDVERLAEARRNMPGQRSRIAITNGDRS